MPLNTGQDGCYVIRWAPSVLQNIQAKLSRTVDIGMEHLADKFYAWRLVGVLLFEMHYKTKSPVLKRCICRADYDGVPSDIVRRATLSMPHG